MKHAITVCVFIVFTFFTFTQVYPQTIRTVGSGGDYATLQAAFDAINAGTITGEIELQIISSTVETSATEVTAPTLNASGTGSASYTSITIYPTGAGGYTIATADFYQLIILDGADNVTIDGRVNRTGYTIALTLEHQHTTSNRARTIEFRNSAENNVIRYCKITSSLRAWASGVIHFAGTDQANANNNNIVEYCDITHTAGNRTRHLLYSNGQSATNPNTGNMVRYNNFYNFMNASEYNSSLLSTAINLTAHSSNWTITGNSFYETTSFIPTDAMNYVAIRVSTGNYHNTITNNFIGGREPQCSGLKWDVRSSSAHRFTGIYYSSSSTSNTSLIQNNVIRNFYYESSSPDAWRGIDVHSTSANNVEINYNTIGAEGGTSSITVGCDPLYIPEMNTMGIRLHGPGNYVVTNNRIGSIFAWATHAQRHHLYGIVKTGGSANLTISDNIIGSNSTAASLENYYGNLRGIEIGGNGGYATVENNTIRHLRSVVEGTNPEIPSTIGILITSTAIGTNDWHNIDDNVISNLSTNTENTSALALAGIVVNTNSNIRRRIRRNTVHNISNTATGDVAVHVYGIYHSAGASTISNGRVSENFIHSLNLASTSDNATAAGIRINSGRAEYFNNIINVGGSLSGGYNVYGIFHEGDRYNRYYFNTVYIGGSVSGGNNSYAFYKSNANTDGSFQDNLRNNIFSNSRTNTLGSAKHYAIRLPGTTNLTINYNNYYTHGTGGVLGYLGGDQITLTNWQTATSQDANSLNIDPLFANAGGTDASDYIPAATMTGQSIAGFTTDYFGIARTTPHEMGALLKSYAVWTGATNTTWATTTNWKDDNAPVAASNVIIPDVTNDPVITTSDNTINSLIIEAAGKLTIDPAGSLTITNNLNNIRGIEGLVIKSTASGTGSLIHSTDDVAGTVERYIPASGYHLVSVPVTQASNPVSGWFLWSYLFEFDVDDQEWVGMGSSTNTPLNVNQGYMVYKYPGPQKWQSDTTYAFEGALTNATFSADVSHVGTATYTFNLVPNPYPSAIDWNAASGWTKTNLAGSYWMWRHSANNYGVWNGTTGTHDVTKDIPVGQAFFVQAIDDNPALAMNNDVRLHSSQAFYKEKEEPSNMLRLRAISGAYSDELILLFGDYASPGYNPQYDAAKMYGGEEAPQIYSLSADHHKLTINTQPFTTEKIKIPVGFEMQASGEATFTFNNLANFDPAIPIFLWDKQMDKMTDLRATQQYTFLHQQDNNPDRFELLFNSAVGIDEIQSWQAQTYFHDGSLLLHIPGEITGLTTVHLYNVSGQRVFAGSVNPGRSSISLPGLSGGVYMIQLINAQGVITRKALYR